MVKKSVIVTITNSNFSVSIERFRSNVTSKVYLYIAHCLIPVSKQY